MTGTFTSECSLAPGLSPEKFYVANRLGSADPPQEGTVAVFDVDKDDGTLRWVDMAPVGWHPRHFKIDPSNKWMLVSAVHDDAVGVYQLDERGVPQRTGVPCVYSYHEETADKDVSFPEEDRKGCRFVKTSLSQPAKTRNIDEPPWQTQEPAGADSDARTLFRAGKTTQRHSDCLSKVQSETIDKNGA